MTTLNYKINKRRRTRRSLAVQQNGGEQQRGQLELEVGRILAPP